MNTNRGPNSMRSAGSRTPFATTDSTTQMMQVLASNSMIPMGVYQNMEKDLDWGALAQQWIRMREQWSQPANEFIPSPPPPPCFSDANEQYPPQTSYEAVKSVVMYNAQHGDAGRTLSAYEEQGEAPMEVEKEDDNPSASLFGGLSVVPEQPIINPSATAAVASWQAKINQLYGMDITNEPTSMRTGGVALSTNQRSSTRVGSSVDTELKLTLHRGLMERETNLSGMGSSCDLVSSSLNGAKDSYAGGSISMNEAKRKLLPAWIREGLEKMERDKQRQLEREQERKMWEEEQKRRRSMENVAVESWSSPKIETSPTRDVPSKAEDEADLSPDQTPVSETNETTVENADDEFELLSVVVRTTLTEILLDVTGSMINSIAKETVAKVNKRKGKQVKAAQLKTGMATCIGSLGLGIYGDSDEDDEDDEDDEEAKPQSASKEATRSDSVRDDSTDDELSDSAVEQKLKETIRRKQRDFEVAAREIERWVCSLQQGTRDPDGSDPIGMHQLFRKTERDARAYNSGDENLDQDDGDEERSMLSDDASFQRSGSHGSAGSCAINGGAGAKSGGTRTRDGETQPVNDKLYASQQSAGRKRREKRVSRFSELQEPRNQQSSTVNTSPLPVGLTYKLSPPDHPALPRSRTGDVAKPLASDVLLKANHALAQQKQLFSLVRSSGSALTFGSHPAEGVVGAIPGSASAEECFKRYLQTIQPSSSTETNDTRHKAAPGDLSDENGGKIGRLKAPDVDDGSSSAVSARLADRKSSSSDRFHQDRAEKGSSGIDSSHHRSQRRSGRDSYRYRSRSKSSRSYTRSPHSVSGSTRSRSSRSRSRSAHRNAAGRSSSRHHHRSERSRHRGSRRRTRSRSRTDSRSRSRSRSGGRFRHSVSSKYSSRRRY